MKRRRRGDESHRNEAGLQKSGAPKKTWRSYRIILRSQLVMELPYRYRIFRPKLNSDQGARRLLKMCSTSAAIDLEEHFWKTE